MSDDVRKKPLFLPTALLRLAFLAVFAINVVCAVSFIANPAAYAPSYQLTGVSGMVAVQGIGVAFLMWNATYPAFIASPKRFPVLGWIILAQQLIGIVGESLILATLSAYAGTGAVSADMSVLSASIMRFIIFDAGGFVAMLATFLWWTLLRRSIPLG